MQASASAGAGSSNSAPAITSRRHVPQLALRHEKGTGAHPSSHTSTSRPPPGTEISSGVDSGVSKTTIGTLTLLALFQSDSMLCPRIGLKRSSGRSMKIRAGLGSPRDKHEARVHGQGAEDGIGAECLVSYTGIRNYQRNPSSLPTDPGDGAHRCAELARPGLARFAAVESRVAAPRAHLPSA